MDKGRTKYRDHMLRTFGGLDDLVRDEDLAEAARKPRVRKLASYGDANIETDIKNGLTDAEIANKIIERYPDMTLEQAKEVIKNLKETGSGKWNEVYMRSYGKLAAGYYVPVAKMLEKLDDIMAQAAELQQETGSQVIQEAVAPLQQVKEALGKAMMEMQMLDTPGTGPVPMGKPIMEPTMGGRRKKQAADQLGTVIQGWLYDFGQTCHDTSVNFDQLSEVARNVMNQVDWSEEWILRALETGWMSKE